MRKFAALGVLVALGVCSPSFAQVRATLYPLKGERTPLFTLEVTEETLELGGRTITLVHKDMGGEMVMRERAYLVNGRLNRFTYEQFQLKESGEIVVRDDEVRFELKTEKKTSKSSEAREKNFTVPVLLLDEVRAHWSKLLAGEPLKIRLGLVERLETIGFKITKERDLEFKGEPAVELRMRPTSPFISALVDPIFLVLSPDGKRLLQRRGRTPVRIMRDEKWRDFDALIE